MSQHADHIVSQIKDPTLASDNTLHVIGVVSNPVRFHSRYRLFRQWLAEMEATPNVRVYVVELAYGDRRFEITDPANPRHHQVRSHQAIWHKENMINLGIRHLLPKDWKYVAWIDGDVHFCNPNWAQEALHALQTHPLIQPFQHALDLGFEGDVLSSFDSFSSLARRGVRMQTCPTDPYRFGHSGYAWCASRRFIEQVGGLMDFPILGSADHHQAWAAINGVDNSVHGGVGEAFKRRCRDWQRRAYMITKGNVGFVKGRIEHSWHGPKASRAYRSRWGILIDHKFDPDTDLMYDQQGLLMLIGKPKLEQAIWSYLTNRNEDSIDPD